MVNEHREKMEFYITQIKEVYDRTPNKAIAHIRNVGYIFGLYDGNAIDTPESGKLLTLNSKLGKEHGVFNEVEKIEI